MYSLYNWSLCYIAEINTTLKINCTWIKFFKKRKKAVYSQRYWLHKHTGIHCKFVTCHINIHGTTIVSSQTILLSKRLLLWSQEARCQRRTSEAPESSLLCALRADVVLEKRLHLCPPAHLGGLALKAAFLPSSLAFQHLRHPGEQRDGQGGVSLREKSREKQGQPWSFPHGLRGEGEKK